MKISELKDKLFESYEDGDASDDELVQIIEQASTYLNLKTHTNYAKANNISYNGAKKRKLRSVTIDNVKFIIDNE